MAYGDGREGEEKSFPYHGPSGFPAGGNPVARVGGPESSSASSRGTRGVMYVRCQEPECRRVFDEVEVNLADKANGEFSDGICPTCLPRVVRRHREDAGLSLDCESCGEQVAIDGVCPICHVGHDGPRCVDCGRRAFHRGDCPAMQPPPLERLLQEAHLTGLGLNDLPGGVA